MADKSSEREEERSDDHVTAVYQFRLEEKATVSEFVAIVDGNKIKGVIQEKEQAKDTYVRGSPITCTLGTIPHQFLQHSG